MSLRRAAVPAIVLALLGSMVPAAQAMPSADRKLTPKELPRPERPRELKDRTHEPHTVLVQFKAGISATARERALKSRGGRSTGTIPGTSFVKVTTKGAAADVARELGKDPKVRRVSLDYRRTASAVPNDPGYVYNDQDYLKTIRMPQAWDRTQGSTSQVIAVVDTGVNGSHEDLYGRVLGGYNALTNTLTAANASTDDNGHGTMTAGIAAANTNNGLGIAGVAWAGGRVMPVKVLDAKGSGWDSDIAEGITWAANHGAKVINLSLGGYEDNPVLHDAIASASAKGAVVVAASGNDGNDTPQYPAAYPEVLAVGATDKGGRLTDFSSYGDWIDVAAPGFGIVAPGSGQDYYVGDGTSFAAPMAAGVASLVRSVYPTLTPAQVIDRIKATARDAGPRGIDPFYGHGVLDAAYAVGGTKTTDFPAPVLGTSEPNNVPAGATVMTGSVSGTMAMEGDVDWYRIESTEKRTIAITVTPAALDANLAQNLDPMLSVYNGDLQVLGEADAAGTGGAEKVTVTVGAGTTYVNVRNWNGAADLRPYTVSLAPGVPTLFDPYTTTDVGSWPETVAIGDVTGDGRNDVLLTTSYYFDEANDFKLFLFPQQADGSLGAAVKFPTKQVYTDGQSSLELLDVDGDGRRDVAMTSSVGIEVFRQTEAGTLVESDPIPGTVGAKWILAADMDADKDTDLLMSGAAGVTLLTRQPDNSFVSSAVTPDYAGELEVGDVDGNGRVDVVAFGGTTVRVYHQTEAGWTQTNHATGASWSGSGVDVADVNGDGRADVIATASGNRPNSFISVMTQNASGGLNAPVLYPVVDIPEPVESADIDGDSRMDVVAAHGGWHTLSVLQQKADGTLATPATSSIPYASHYNAQGGLALGDVNGDKQVDAVLADSSAGLVVLRNAYGPTRGGEPVWVRNVTPGENASGQSSSTTPTVTFQRALDPTSVTASTVRLVNAKTGATVNAVTSYDATTRTVTVKPTTSLPGNTPFRIVVSGVRDSAGATQAEVFTSTFRTGWLRIVRRFSW